MLNIRLLKNYVPLILISLAVGQAVSTARACTRAVYLGPEGRVVTGRTMDWAEEVHSNLWIFPRGLERQGIYTANPLKWKSQYGSVVTSMYGGASADGMNEQGLVANMLYLAESKYPAEDGRPGLCVSAWAQYVLDSFATVEEVVKGHEKNDFRLVGVVAPNGAQGTVHLAVSDPSGDSAIIECIDGKLRIHHSRDYQVMTNSPEFSQQLALNAYWQAIGGTVMLPGTNRAADRFARASFYIQACHQTADQREAVAATFSVMRNVSVPRGISTPSQPNISSTLWRTVADQKAKIYYFESTYNPSIVWVNLNKINFAPNTGVRKLGLTAELDLTGDQTQNFKPSEPYKFLVD